MHFLCVKSASGQKNFFFSLVHSGQVDFMDEKGSRNRLWFPDSD